MPKGERLRQAALKKPKNRRQRRTQEAAASLADAKEISLDSARAAVSSELDDIFALKKQSVS